MNFNLKEENSFKNIFEIGDSIAIWGGGKQGKNAYYTLKRKYDIICFLDSDVRKENLEIVDGKKVLFVCLDSFFIVIACEQWMDVSKKLLKEGLHLLDNFLPYNMLQMKNIRLDVLLDCFDAISVKKYLKKIKIKKKIALIYGNCQTEILANMIEHNKEFSEKYVLLRVPQIHLYRDEKQVEEIFYKNNIMEMLDLFIYQKVKINNRYFEKLGTNSILEKIRTDCKKLIIHNIFFDGYFIQCKGSDDRYIENMNQKNFPYFDVIVDSLITEGKNVKDILNLLFRIDLFDDNTIQKRCKRSIHILKQKEESVDIPIVDYIENNYQKRQLFYTHNHPKNIVIYEYVKRILKALTIEKIDEFTEEELYLEFGSLRINNFPILPCVIKALGLENYELKMRISDVTPKLLSIEDYMKEYIYRCYGRK